MLPFFSHDNLNLATLNMTVCSG